MTASNETSDVRQALTDAFPLVDDHPDVAGLLRDPTALATIGPALATPFRECGATVVVAPEARGPILGALVARELGVGLVLVRKDRRNHPGADIVIESPPTWRGHTERFLARSFDLDESDRVVIVDDWITTGASIEAATDFATKCGAEVVGAAVLVNKATDEVVLRFGVHWLVSFDDLVEPG